ncbi:MAG: alkaline phosphatase family protein [Legionella sp.]|nr:alkaline phosphatase family protein [Legionella sp.]
MRLAQKKLVIFVCFLCVILVIFFLYKATYQDSLRFKKVFIVVFENADAKHVLERPYFKSLTKKGAYLSQFYAETRPSQPNYIAMTAGDTYGVQDNKIHDLDVTHIADLLESKGKTWKAYNEDYPGNCFLGKKQDKYRRKHNPFISYTNISSNPSRCVQHVVDAKELWRDIKAQEIPDYSFYVPNNDNNGHDKGIAFADKWLEKTFGPLLENEQFMKDMLFVITFDESTRASPNHIYTLLLGDHIIPGKINHTRHNFYSLLRLIEEEMNLGTLHKKDATATQIIDIWR